MTSAALPDLFTSLKMGPLMLPNRIVMAPMTRNRAGEGMVPGDLMVSYYAQRATAGLIVSEGAPISPQAVGYPNTPGLYNAEQVRGWKRVTAAVHARGGRIFAQLWHVGRISHPSLQPGGGLPVAPSALRPEGMAITAQGPQPFVAPRALTLDEITRIVEDYEAAAQNALDAGFDGVEIHAANGYLLDQFLRDGSNLRTDCYGGDPQGRMRFLLEVMDGVCSVWGASRVGLRISPLQPFNDMRDSNPEYLFTQLVKALNSFDLAYLHVTEMGKDAPDQAGPGFDLSVLRGLWRGLYMTNGGYDRDSATLALQSGAADMVSFGALYIANPDLVERFAAGGPFNTPDTSTYYGGGAKGYTDYPAMPRLPGAA